MMNKNAFIFITRYVNIYTAFFTPGIQMKRFSPQEFKAKALRSTREQAGSRYHSCSSSTGKGKGEQEERRVCIKSMADKSGCSTPSSMGRLMLDKHRTTALGTATISELTTLQENSPFCQMFPSILLQVTASQPSLQSHITGVTLSPGKQAGPWP